MGRANQMDPNRGVTEEAVGVIDEGLGEAYDVVRTVYETLADIIIAAGKNVEIALLAANMTQIDTVSANVASIGNVSANIAGVNEVALHMDDVLGVFDAAESAETSASQAEAAKVVTQTARDNTIAAIAAFTGAMALVSGAGTVGYDIGQTYSNGTVGKAIQNLAALMPIISTQSEAEGLSNNTTMMTPLRVKQAVEGKADARATITASEAIAQGNFVNVYDSGSGLRVRKAIANDPLKFANGYAPDAISSGVPGYIKFLGLNPITSVTTTSEVWLSDSVAGTSTSTPPTASGSIIQSLGPAVAGLGVFFSLSGRILL